MSKLSKLLALIMAAAMVFSLGSAALADAEPEEGVMTTTGALAEESPFSIEDGYLVGEYAAEGSFIEIKVNASGAGAGFDAVSIKVAAEDINIVEVFVDGETVMSVTLEPEPEVPDEPADDPTDEPSGEPSNVISLIGLSINKTKALDPAEAVCCEFAGPNAVTMNQQMEVIGENWFRVEDGEAVDKADLTADDIGSGAYDFNLVIRINEGFSLGDDLQVSTTPSNAWSVSDGDGMVVHGDTVEITNFLAASGTSLGGSSASGEPTDEPGGEPSDEPSDEPSGEPGPVKVTLSEDGTSARVENFRDGLYVRAALLLDKGGVTGLYVTQCGVTEDGTVIIPAFNVPGLEVKGICVAVVDNLEDICDPAFTPVDDSVDMIFM